MNKFKSIKKKQVESMKIIEAQKYKLQNLSFKKSHHYIKITTRCDSCVLRVN